MLVKYMSQRTASYSMSAQSHSLIVCMELMYKFINEISNCLLERQSPFVRLMYYPVLLKLWTSKFTFIKNIFEIFVFSFRIIRLLLLRKAERQYGSSQNKTLHANHNHRIISELEINLYYKLYRIHLIVNTLDK